VDGLVVGWGGGRGGSSPHVQVAEIQRARLLAATVGTIEEFGYAGATVARITARARISRRTFYEMFSNCEECLVAVLEGTLQRIEAELARAGLDGLPWRERVRKGLWTILAFFDREPTVARLCVVQSLRGSETVLQRRAEVFAQLASAIEEGRGEGPRGAEAPQLTAEGLVGAAHAIVYERLLKRSSEPLTGLLDGLMGLIVLPYLGPAVARREQSRPIPPAPAPSDGSGDSSSEPAGAERDPLEGVAMRLTYRTARVLECIARQPGISNRMVGDQAGISDQGQASKLLARLQRLGLATNTGPGHSKGEPNAWHLTPTGTQVANSIRTYTPTHKEAA
jgi:AcrR family transcriptional regulator